MADGQLNNADAFRPIVVSYRNGAPVRLDQVANVIDSVENVMQRPGSITKDATGKPTRSARSRCRCMQQPGTNVIEVTDAVRAVLPAFEAQLPPSVASRHPPGSLAHHPRRRSATSR